MYKEYAKGADQMDEKELFEMAHEQIKDALENYNYDDYSDNYGPVTDF